MSVYEYLYERPVFEPGPASVFVCQGGLVDTLSIGRDNLATFWREGLTQAGGELIDAIFSFTEIYGFEVSFVHRKIAITTTEELTNERKAKLDQLIGSLNNLESWAFIEDARNTITANTTPV